MAAGRLNDILSPYEKKSLYWEKFCAHTMWKWVSELPEQVIKVQAKQKRKIEPNTNGWIVFWYYVTWRGRLARVTQNSHQSQFSKWAKGCSFTIALSGTFYTYVRTFINVCINSSFQTRHGIDGYKQMVAIRIQLVDVMWYFPVDSNTYTVLVFFHLHFFFPINLYKYYAIKSIRVWSFTFSTSTPLRIAFWYTFDNSTNTVHTGFHDRNEIYQSQTSFVTRFM